MAEIRVEPKRGGGLGWLWALIIVLVLAALAWYFFAYRRDTAAVGWTEGREAPALVAASRAPLGA